MKSIEVKLRHEDKKFFIHGWLHPNKKDDEKYRVKGATDEGVVTTIYFDKLKGVSKGQINEIHRENFGESVATGIHHKKSSDNKRVQELLALIPETKSELGHTVYKLYYGDRFLIHKGMTLAGSLISFIKGYANFEANKHKGYQDKSNHFYKAYSYILRHPGLEFNVFVIGSGTWPFATLAEEQLLLLDEIKNPKCLNSNISAYIPKTVKNGLRGGWISEEDIKEFVRLFSDRVDFPENTLQQQAPAMSAQ